MYKTGLLRAVAGLARCALCLLAVLALASCGGRRSADSDAAPSRRTLAVSIEPLRSMLEPLAGDRFEVISIMDRGIDAETFEPSMGRRMAAERSSRIFITGVLPFEKALAAVLPDSVGAVDLSRSVDLLYGTHDHAMGHHHADADTTHNGIPDPHIWTSIRNARRITRAMAAELARIDPEGAPLYAARCDSICHVLDGLDEYARLRLRNAPSASFLVWHPSLSYFARDYGLRQVALGTEGKDLSPAGLRQAIDSARASGARVFLAQRGVNSRQAVSVSAEVGTRMVEIDLMSPHWQEQIKYIADEISRH